MWKDKLNLYILMYTRKYKRLIYLVFFVAMPVIILSVAAAALYSDWAGRRLTREEALEDFNYLMRVLEENFPHYGVIERRSGIDLHKKSRALHDQLTAGRGRVLLRDFWDMLNDEYFSHADNAGNFWLVTNTERKWLMAVLGKIPEDEADYTDFTPLHSHLYDVLRDPPRYICPDDRNYGIIPADNFNFSIIDEGRVAYLRLRVLVPPSERYQRVLHHYYKTLAGYEHFIIDMRGSRGGWLSVFFDYLVSPLINRPVTGDYHVFYKNGGHNEIFLQASRELNNRVVTSNGMFTQNNLPLYFREDVAALDSFLSYSHTVRPADENARIPFSGSIWLLVDGQTTSSANNAAAFSKQTGFATVVGETTGGISGYPWSNYFSLPHSGFIVRYDPAYAVGMDNQPLEYGVTPHYFNQPGMDALETVLDKIYGQDGKTGNTPRIREDAYRMLTFGEALEIMGSVESYIQNFRTPTK